MNHSTLIDQARKHVKLWESWRPVNHTVWANDASDLITQLAAELERLERKPLTDEQIKRAVLLTVYEGDASTPYRDAWTAEVGIPFARAIERAHHIVEGEGK